MKNTLKNMRKRLGRNGDWSLREEALLTTFILFIIIIVVVVLN